MQEESVTTSPDTHEDYPQEPGYEDYEFLDSGSYGVEDCDQEVLAELGRRHLRIVSEKEKIDRRPEWIAYGREGVKDLLTNFGIDVRYNIRADKVEFHYDPDNDLYSFYHDWATHGPTGNPWQRWTEDGIGDAIRASAAELVHTRVKDGKDSDGNQRYSHKRWEMGDQAWRKAINALCHDQHRRVDPFIVWLEELPAWDGTERVETLLHDVLGAEKDKLSAWAARTIIVGAIARSYNPGEVCHEHCILIGSQGIGKGSLIQALLHDPDWYGTIHMDADPKKRIERTLGKVIVEWDELAGTSRAEVEAIKSILSSSADRERLAYRRDADDIYRRWILCGSSNSEQAIPYDPTGSRRFVAIPCAGGKMDGRDVSKHVAALRDQLWAEARDRRAAGEEGWQHGRLPRELAPAQEERNVEHRQTDPTLDELLMTLPARPAKFSAIAEHVGMMEKGRPMERREQLRLSGVLKSHGWTSRRGRLGDGKVSVIYDPPEGWDERPQLDGLGEEIF